MCKLSNGLGNKVQNGENQDVQNSSFVSENVSSSDGLEGKVPELRFSSYSNPWITEKLSDFTIRITRKNNKNQTNLPLTISSKDGLVDQVTFFNKKVSSKDMSGYYLLQKGEFAYNKSYSNGYDFGSIKRLECYENGALSTLYICFALTKYCSDYIKHYFDSLKWYRQMYIISAEGARNHGLLNIPTDDFFATTHYLSQSLSEQQKIANFLSLIDKRIEKQKQLVESLRRYKRGSLIKIFNNIPKTVKLSDISSFISSSRTLSNTLNNNKGIYPVYDATGIAGYIDHYDVDFDYIAIVKDGSVGRLQKCDKKSSFIGTLGALVAKNCTTDFLYAVLQIIDFSKFITGTIIPHIYYSDYKNILLPFPSKDKQHFISHFLTKIDTNIENENKKLTNMLKYKHGLLQQMFI